MNAVGIDVSKGSSFVTVIKPFGEILIKPYKVLHTVIELKNLAESLKSLNGETRIIMEATGVYSRPIADYLHKTGLSVYVVNAKEVYNFDKDALRKVKTDKADCRKIAKFGVSNWEKLRKYELDETRQVLQIYARQYESYSKIKTMLKNNLKAILEQSFPEISEIFTSPVRADGHEKWVDFAESFWHSECVSSVSRGKFSEKYRKWCAKRGYFFKQTNADKIYETSQKYVAVMPKNELSQFLIQQAVKQINAVSKTQSEVLLKIKELAKTMPEWEIVRGMCGVGETLAAQLIAEIGDITRFSRKQSLTGFAGVDSPQKQSGSMDKQGQPVTKSGNAHLRRILFLVISALLIHQSDDKVYNFVAKKRSEGKPYKVYVVAGMNKFLKIYYGKVKEHIERFKS